MSPVLRHIVPVAWVIAIVAFGLVPVIGTPLTMFVLSEALVFGVAAVSLNLLVGFGKLVSFGHAAWWGLGGYSTAILLQKSTGLGILGALLAGAVLTGAISVVVGFFCVRRGAIYFSMLTLAFGQLLMLGVLRWRSVTGGEQGLTGGVPRPDVGPLDVTDPRNYYWFTAVVSLAAIGCMAWILASPFGLTLRALAADPVRAAATGVNVRLHQLITFVLAAMFASIGGGLHAVSQSSAFPESLSWATSATFVFMGLVGGIGYLAGPLVGAVVYVYIERFAGDFFGSRDLVLGILLLAIVLGMRGGFLGLFVDLWEWASRRRERRSDEEKSSHQADERSKAPTSAGREREGNR